jgi:DNA-binding SARP family transcriptional activator/tetratricopeptide (TPR) repeat protein
VRFAILGPLLVTDDSGTMGLSGRNIRVLLAALLSSPNHPVSVAMLTDSLWEDAPPKTGAKNIQVLVHHLRRALGEDRVVRHAQAYSLVVEPGELDAWVFRERAAQGTKSVAAGDLRHGRDLFVEALALWRGEVFADLGDVATLRATAAGLSEHRLAVVEARIEAELALGGHETVARETAALVQAYPLRERLRELQMTALYRCGRQGEALQAYRSARAFLVGELGVEPTTALQRVHAAILAGHDPAPPGRVEGLAGSAQSRTPPPPWQLPPAVGDFSGRHRERAELRTLLSCPQKTGTPAIVLLSGMGGIGKTTLAVRTALDLREAFPDGCLHAELRGLDSDPPSASTILSAFLRSLGVPGADVPQDPDERLGLYRSLTARRALLVVLDNAAAEEQVRPLIPTGDRCAALLTSRSALRGLEGTSRVRVEPFGGEEAAIMVRAIAGPLPQSTMSALVDACAGVPLALRIAASRIAPRADLAPEHLVRRITTQGSLLDELRVGDRSVRANLDRSYRALEEAPALLLRLFAASSLSDAAPSTLAALLGHDRPTAEGCVELLSDVALLIPSVLTDTEPRFRFHDLVRAFAREKAAQDSEAVRSAAWIRLADHCLDRVYAAASVITAGRSDYSAPSVTPVPDPASFADAASAADWFETERPDLLAVVRACVADGRHEQAYRLVHGMTSLLRRGHHADDWLAISHETLDACLDAGDHRGEAHMRESLGSALFTAYRFSESLEQHSEAIAVNAALDDRLAVARNRNSLALVFTKMERLDEAEENYRAALDESGYVAQPLIYAYTCLNLGAVLGKREDHVAALDSALRGLEAAADTVDSQLLCVLHHNAGESLNRLGRPAEAEQHAIAELELARRDRRPLQEARGLDLLGDCHFGDSPATALYWWKQALELYRRLDHPYARLMEEQIARYEA